MWAWSIVTSVLLTCIWTLLPAAMLDTVQQASFLMDSWSLLHKCSNAVNTEQFSTTCNTYHLHTDTVGKYTAS